MRCAGQEARFHTLHPNFGLRLLQGLLLDLQGFARLLFVLYNARRPIVLYGCETWSLFENRVLRRIFGPKRDEVTGEWRKLHNEELHNL
jgi:hypothetical protein